MSDDPVASYGAMNTAVGGRRASASKPVLPCEKGKMRVRIVLKDDDFAIIKGKDYKLVVQAETFEGNSGSAGLVDHLVAESATTGELSVWLSPSQPPLIWDLKIGALDPLGVSGGAEGRLDNLGLGEKPEAPIWTLKHEIGEFQRLFELDPTTAIDGKTTAEIERIYSSRDEPLEGSGRWVPIGDE